jgi:hypothetical protein
MLHRHDRGMSFRMRFMEGYAMSLPHPEIPGPWSGHPLRAAHFINKEQVMTIQGWHTPALCHYDNARRNCHRCRVHFETRVVRRHVGMFLASQGFSVSLEELAAVRD